MNKLIIVFAGVFTAVSMSFLPFVANKGRYQAIVVPRQNSHYNGHPTNHDIVYILDTKTGEYKIGAF